GALALDTVHHVLTLRVHDRDVLTHLQALDRGGQGALVGGLEADRLGPRAGALLRGHRTGAHARPVVGRHDARLAAREARGGVAALLVGVHGGAAEARRVADGDHDALRGLAVRGQHLAVDGGAGYRLDVDVVRLALLHRERLRVRSAHGVAAVGREEVGGVGRVDRLDLVAAGSHAGEGVAAVRVGLTRRR